MLKEENPHVLADRSINPKVSDVYNMFNKWRKCNLGTRTGNDLFEELEKRVNIYNEEHKECGGRALLKRFCKGKSGSCDQPLILAICTPLMSRVHEHVVQAGELVYVDSTSSLDDFNNPMFVLSTSAAAGGLPLGVVITSGESASTIHQAMSTLQELFPRCAFHGKGSPANIILDDSSAEKEGLHVTWPLAKLYLCIFHFLQSMWRWLCNGNNGIAKDDRQHLMQCVRKLVYAQTEENLKQTYKSLERGTISSKYSNFNKHLESYWKRRHEWALCYRDLTLVRGNNTNNYCEAGIRILKDIVFKRIKAYNLVQTFEFMTVTFELYYECRLLAVAYNRMDRYLSLRFKGLGASSIAESDITPQSSPNTYIVKSQTYEGVEYQVDTAAWNCNCSVGWSGHPSGEPCKHQAAVAKAYKLSAPNLVPYFSSEGRYLHAVIAVGVSKAGEKSFYQRTTFMPTIFHRTPTISNFLSLPTDSK